MPDVSIKINTQEFQRVFKEYRKVSRRGLAEDLNQKAYSINIAAVAITKRGSKSAIRKYLKSESRDYPPAPIAAILVNKRRGIGHGLYGQRMKEEVNEFIRKQADSVNFLRAGWLSAVMVFAKAIGKAPGANAVRFLARFGYGKYGGGEIARPGFNPTATFYNMAFSRDTSTNNGIRFAQQGLQRAVDQEAKRMAPYIARKMQERANKVVQRLFS